METTFMKYLVRIVKVIIVPIILFAIIWIIKPERVSVTNVVSMIVQAVLPAILAWGVLFDIKVGNWDFAVGAEVLVASILGGNIAKSLNLGITGVIICCILVGFLFGAINGAIYLLLKVPTIITSIGLMLVTESVCGVIFGGGGINLPTGWATLGSNTAKIIAGIIAFLLAYYLYNVRKMGYQVRAVGNGMNIAKLNGINVLKIKYMSMMVAGLFAGIFAAMNLAGTGVTRPVGSMGSMAMVFDAMMCVFVGMAFQKSANMVITVYIGSIIMQIIKLGLMLFGFPSMFNQVVIAVIVLVFMSITSRGMIAKKKVKKETAPQAG